ncbi:MAG: hypothetical protein ACE5HJ_00325 [Thermoplasmata archaeon]
MPAETALLGDDVEASPHPLGFSRGPEDANQGPRQIVLGLGARLPVGPEQLPWWSTRGPTEGDVE